jgi:hypothetical protein
MGEHPVKPSQPSHENSVHERGYGKGIPGQRRMPGFASGKTEQVLVRIIRGIADLFIRMPGFHNRLSLSEKKVQHKETGHLFLPLE